MSSVSLGLGTFGDVGPEPDGAAPPMHQVLREVVEQGALADRCGVDHFVLGEHHRPDFAISCPEVVLAAVAARTERITLSSGVTVLSTDDPVRVYERFATLDGLSDGRAEIQVGRGSFTEPFELFGHDLSDYVVLFDDKLDLLSRLRTEDTLSWHGRTRPALTDAHAFPTTRRGSLPVWVGVGGTTESVVRTARYGLPMMLAIVGGPPERFASFVELFHTSVEEAGTGPTGGRLPVGVHSPGFVADTDDEARDQLFPHYKASRDRIGRDRGWGEMTREQFDAEVDAGSLYVGSPRTVAERIATTIRTLGIDRFDLRYAHGPQPHDELMHTVELYGTQVIPRVRELLGQSGE
ncbi:LLM class flavin-dependent oxidoreductase [Isoptericola sp. b441]|uniref:LLM class flavin-dependent oxidoreductase n=1 Tax=Actinotalea lenta TaxID=3064654 RepID=A0ABT9DA45_9CELL|nr:MULTISPECIES: Atu2307/SP_0267 family LLM class monooxygenase [unclassified Isoptericola]MDO8105822.1 LLM class flavin-dependent oxidoreductase [Isoptericola sp. b441]MDO8122527.1 LLM class flavin-dependent oxidoreductase [Isoptericola sp. b490]